MKKLMLPLLAMLTFGGSAFAGWKIQSIVMPEDAAGTARDDGSGHHSQGDPAGHGKELETLSKVDLGTLTAQIPQISKDKVTVLKVDITIDATGPIPSQAEMRHSLQEMLITSLEMPLVNTAPDILSAMELVIPVAAAERSPWLKEVDLRVLNNLQVKPVAELGH